MQQEENKKVVVESKADKVLLTVDEVTLTMSATLARELGDALYKCGCDVAARAE